MFRSYSKLFTAYFSKLRPSHPQASPLSPHRLWMRRLVLPVSATLGYNLMPFFSKQDKEEKKEV